MAVSDEQAFGDMYWPMKFSEYDERVVVDGWVFYVRAIKFKHDLSGGRFRRDDLATILLNATADALAARLLPWRVGIVRRGEISTWNDERIQIVHHEKLPAKVHPTARIAELVEQVRAGDHLPARTD